LRNPECPIDETIIAAENGFGLGIEIFIDPNDKSVRRYLLVSPSSRFWID
jgi:hypothetical protein